MMWEEYNLKRWDFAKLWPRLWRIQLPIWVHQTSMSKSGEVVTPALRRLWMICIVYKYTDRYYINIYRDIIYIYIIYIYIYTHMCVCVTMPKWAVFQSPVAGRLLSTGGWPEDRKIEGLISVCRLHFQVLHRKLKSRHRNILWEWTGMLGHVKLVIQPIQPISIILRKRGSYHSRWFFTQLTSFFRGGAELETIPRPYYPCCFTSEWIQGIAPWETRYPKIKWLFRNSVSPIETGDIWSKSNHFQT